MALPYDIEMQDSAVNDGTWCPFHLAWLNRGGIGGLFQKPHLKWYPFYLDPAFPEEPNKGHFGLLQWHLEILVAPGVTGLTGNLADGTDVATRLAWLGQFRVLGLFNFKDVDGVVHEVAMVGFELRNIEPYDLAHGAGGEGGWLATVELVKP
jgi:hypothetical protein